MKVEEDESKALMPNSDASRVAQAGVIKKEDESMELTPNSDASRVPRQAGIAVGSSRSHAQDVKVETKVDPEELKPKINNDGENMEDDDMEDDEDEDEDDDEDVEDSFGDADALQETLGDLLSSAFTHSSGGSFAASGLLSGAPNPGLDVIGLGTLGLPLSESEAKRIASFSEQAPFGKGAETLVDLNVRKTWQIDASKIRFNNPEWNNYIQTNLVPEACRSLGIPPTDVKANLYKLLLYTPGGHFEKHQDTEKEPGMFGTLIIVLPSPYLGGAFEATHPSDRSKTKIFDLAPTSDFKVSYIVLYTDVFHKIHPVTMGNRLALSFNLVYSMTPGVERPLLRAGALLPGQAELLGCLKAWAKRIKYNGDAPQYIAHVLDHKYSQMGLSFKTLKGKDRVKVGWLLDVAQEVDLGMQLAHLELTITGTSASCGYGGGYDRWGRYGRRYGGCAFDDEDEDEDHEMEEETDREFEATNFLNIDGTRALPAFQVEQDSLCPAVELTDSDPDNKESEGYQGNYGGDVTHWYHRTALVLWPGAGRAASYSARIADAAEAAAGPKLSAAQVACQLLNRAIERFLSAPESEQAQCRTEVLKAVEATPKDQTSAPVLTRAAITLGQEDVFRKTVLETPANQVLASLPKELWIEASERFGNEYVRQLLDQVFRGVGSREPLDNNSSLSRAWSLLNGLEKTAPALALQEWVNNRRLELVVKFPSLSTSTVPAILALCKKLNFERCRPMLESVFEGIVKPSLEKTDFTSADHTLFTCVHTFIRDLPGTFSDDAAKAWCRERPAGLLQHIRTMDDQLLPLILTICSQISFDKLQLGLERLVSELERKDASPSVSTSYPYYASSGRSNLNKLASDLVSKVLALHPADATAAAWAEDHSLKLNASSLMKDLTQEQANKILTLVKQRGFSRSHSLLDNVFQTIIADLAKGVSYHSYRNSHGAKFEVAYNMLINISTAFSADNAAQVWTNEQLAKLLPEKEDWDVTNVPMLVTAAEKLTYPAVEKLVLAKIYHKHGTNGSYDAFWRALGVQLLASSSIDSSRVLPFIRTLYGGLASRVTKNSICSTDYMGRSTTDCQPVLDIMDLYLKASDSNELQKFVLKFTPANEPELGRISKPLVSALRPFLAARGLSFQQPPWAPLLKATLRTASSSYDPHKPPAPPPSRVLQVVGEPTLDSFLRSPVEHVLMFQGVVSIRKKLESRLSSLSRSREITMETIKSNTPHTLVVKKVGAGQPQSLTGTLNKATIDSWQKAVDSCQNRGYYAMSASSGCSTCKAISACIAWSKGQATLKGLVADVGGLNVANAILTGVSTANASAASSSSSSSAAPGPPQGGNTNSLKRKREGVDLGVVELD